MYLLNLTLVQFVVVFGAVSVIALALYLLDRARRRQVVSTLHFWTAAGQPTAEVRRRRLQQPWSLVLQLLSMLLLLLAAAQLRMGAPAQAGRNHVLVLDTSAWMGARTGNRTLMDTARDRAIQYVRALPGRDRVMLVRADALSTPVTAFEPDRRKIEAAIARSAPGATALNLEQAFTFARKAQLEQADRAGEIVFVGAGRTAESDAAAPPSNARVIAVPDAIENYGLRKIGMRRSSADGDTWEIYIAAHNYGTAQHAVTLGLTFQPLANAGYGVEAGSRRLLLAPGADAEASFEYRTREPGTMDVSLAPHDAFAGDDHAALELPGDRVLDVTVYSDDPAVLRPVLAATRRLAVTYRKPSEYRAGDQGLVILDRFCPSERPASDAIWIDPPPSGSPIPVRNTLSGVAFGGWNAESSVAAGLREVDFKLDRAQVFEAAPSDVKVAEVAEGPVIVVRPGKPKTVVLGFQPGQSALRYRLVTPLLFANLLRWISPEVFRRAELSAGSVGLAELELEADTKPGELKVTSAGDAELPFTLRGRTLDFFTAKEGTVRVSAGDREYLYSPALPEVGTAKWTPPADVRRGVPRFTQITESGELWPWLALAGALGLLAEWLLYGRGGVRRVLRRHPAAGRRKATVAEAVRR